MVQYLVLLHAHQHPELARWSDNVRQLETLTLCGVISPDTELLLKSAYLEYRASVHRMNLRGEPAQAPEERFRDLNRQISLLWKQVLEAPST